MKVLVVTPAPRGSHHGNRVSAERWGRLLAEVGHEVELAEAFAGQGADALVALHAGRSAESVLRFGAERSHRPIVVVLTGTDLYPDLASTGVQAAVLEVADRLVVLQPLGLRQLPLRLRQKARVIVQSAVAAPRGAGEPDRFEVVMLAHLRAVKDPLLVVEATRLVPGGSRLLVRHFGAALDGDLALEASRQAATNPRYEWLGDRPHREALEALAAARALVITSRYEGGANAVSEALAAAVPVVSTRIAGSVGLLGERYPGYVPVGDARALADMLWALETDRSGLFRRLQRRVGALRPLVDPERERNGWGRLMDELAGG